MTRRFQRDERRWVYRYLCLRDGEKCYLCGGAPSESESLDVEHTDGNNENHDPANLRLAHRGCNVAKENRCRVNRQAKGPGRLKPERDEITPNTRVFKDVIPYQDGSAEMQANAIYETRFRRWLLDYVNTKGFILKRDAINAGAEIAGCNPMSTARYLTKMTSIVGPLLMEKDATGQECIWAKEMPAPSQQLPLSGSAPADQLALLAEQEKQ